MLVNGEEITKEIFSKQFHLTLEKITVDNFPQPDFYVLNNSKKIAICEVKDIVKSIPSEKNGWIKNKFGIWSRADNAPPRIRAKIHEAYKQLKRYDLPRILVFVNFDIMVDIQDLQQAVNGFLPFVSENNPKEIIHVHDPLKVTLKRIENQMSKIDLYIWIDKSGNQKIYFRTIQNNKNKRGLEIYRMYFESFL